MRFAYLSKDTSNNAYYARVFIRYQAGGEKIDLRIKPNVLELKQLKNSTWTTLDTYMWTQSQDTWYEVRAVYDGADIEVWQRERGAGQFAKVLETTAATVTTSTKFVFSVRANALFQVDDVEFITDELSRTTTYTYASNNELLSMTDYNGTLSFGYDELGRMTSKARGTHSATYTYHYDDRLTKVDSNFPGEGLVTAAQAEPSWMGAMGQARCRFVASPALELAGVRGYWFLGIVLEFCPRRVSGESVVGRHLVALW